MAVNGFTHSYTLTILEGHLDTFGHVNHAIYLELLEEARWDLITNNGYGLKDIQKTGQGPVILEAKIEYKRELLLRQKIRIQTELLSYNKKIAVLQQCMYNEADLLCARAEIKFGLFDTKRRKIISPTPIWLKAIGIDPGTMVTTAPESPKSNNEAD